MRLPYFRSTTATILLLVEASAGLPQADIAHHEQADMRRMLKQPLREHATADSLIAGEHAEFTSCL